MSHSQHTVNHRNCCCTSSSHAQRKHTKRTLHDYLSPGRKSGGRAGVAEVRAKWRGPRSSAMRSTTCQSLSSTNSSFCCPASLLDTAQPHSVVCINLHHSRNQGIGFLLIDDFDCSQNWSEQAAGMHVQSSAESFPAMQVCTADYVMGVTLPPLLTRQQHQHSPQHQ